MTPSERIRKEIGKITNIKFGWGGYQEVEFGITINFSLNGGSSGIGTFYGTWGTERSADTKWTEESRVTKLGNICMKAKQWMKDANVTSLDELIGVPVEVTMKNFNEFDTWRVLKEVL